MKRTRFIKSMALVLLPALLTSGAAWGAILETSLSQVPNPVFGTTGGTVPAAVPAHLQSYIKNNAAAVKLGKALFWDMQAGSDGLTACASCHYRAGADSFDIRKKNQINPGSNGTFDGGNACNSVAIIPFAPGNTDVVGSQGVLKTAFTDIILGSSVDAGTPVTDTVFNNGHGVNVPQVTGRNTPPAVNAVFNYDNFWDGRGKHDFNGSSPIGSLDQGAGVWSDPAGNGTLTKVKIAIPNSSLASQAVGPPLSDVEMSWNGRSWPKLGRKMLSLTPLGQQPVHPSDSVLGLLSRATLQGGKLGGAKGLTSTYIQMIKDAFVDSWWDSTGTTTDGFTQMEANFSLFWGLAVQHYEATLVSDQTPVDQFLAGNTAALSDSAQRGLNRFNSFCSSCHSGSEMTGASVSMAEAAIAGGATLIEQDVTGIPGGISDVGFSNIGVMPTADNPGRGAAQAQGFPFPLSFAGEAVFDGLPFTPPFILPPLATTASPLAVAGTFKIPSLRNVELSAPYMHNGSLHSLAQVVDFYNLGGNFPDNPELDVEMKSFAFNAAQRNEMVDFLTALTDERVRNELAPFDHPQLSIPEGDGSRIMLHAKDASGSEAQSTIPPTLTLNALTPLTNKVNATISGKVEAGIVPEVNGANAGPVTFNGTSWSCAVTLSKGVNSLTVKAKDPVGNESAQTAVVNVILPDGCVKGGATPGIDDALKALRIVVQLDQPTVEEKMHGDVAPLVNGKPAPDDKIDIADVLVILKQVVGLITL